MSRRSSPGAVEGRVGEGARVFGRLEVREDARAGQALAEPRLDALDEVVTALDGALDVALPRTEADVAFYLAGADPWEGDRLGRLALTKAGLRARDELVLDRLRATGTRVCVVLAGGYAEDVRDTVDINAATAAAVARRLPYPGGALPGA